MLKGRAATIPNQTILIDTLILQEAMASSEVENLVTSHDEIFRMDPDQFLAQSGPAKEVTRYRDVIKMGHECLKRDQGTISNRTLIEMCGYLTEQNSDFRDVPGTAIRLAQGGKIVYLPPQDPAQIVSMMGGLEEFINNDKLSSLDPLIKMTLIHYQFESIHPFPDGNGRIGRVLCVLYLTRTGLLDFPILYLSRRITQTKQTYYRLLQEVRDRERAQDAWERWVVYMLEVIAESAVITIQIVESMRLQMAKIKNELRTEFPKFYSQDLLNNLFRHPYTRIDYLARDLSVSRQTAAKYLHLLASHGILLKKSFGRNNYYVNAPLANLLVKVSEAG